MDAATSTPATAIDITEQVILPIPKPVAEGVRYKATYVNADGVRFRAELEVRERYRMLTVGTEEISEGRYRAFSSCAPPLALLEPAFAAWLEQFLAECQRRYDARCVTEAQS